MLLPNHFPRSKLILKMSIPLNFSWRDFIYQRKSAFTEAAVQRCYVKKVFLKISPILQEPLVLESLFE